MSQKGMEINRIVVGPVQTNCYVLSDGEEAVIVDGGGETSRIIELVREKGKVPKAVIATHGHFDHVLSVNDLRDYFHIPFLISKKDVPLLNQFSEHIKLFLNADLGLPPEPDGFIEDGDVISVGSSFLTVIGTPGHTHGSVSLLFEDYLFTGDFLFKGSIGRTDVGGSNSEMTKSLDWIKKQNKKLHIYSGHGDFTTLEEELIHNYYLKRDVPEI